jgi:peptide/nickel transport system substrate-binding protein
MRIHLRAAIAPATCVVALAVAGCGSSGNGSTPAASDAAADGGSGANQTLVMAVNSLPDNLTSVPWGGVGSAMVLNGAGAQLTRYKETVPGAACDQPPGGKDVAGNLADSAEISQDGKKVTLKLKELKSPFGHTLSAEDVKFSLERELDIDSIAEDGFADAGYDTKNLVTIVDPRTVELNLKKPTSYTLELLLNNVYTMYDSTEAKKHATAKDKWGNDWLNEHLADYSGWELESFSPGDSLILKANPDWGGERPGNVSRLVIRAVPQSSTREQLITTGDADVAMGLEYDQYKKLDATQGVRVVQCAGYTRDTLILQTKTAPLDDAKVRQAISLAIDRKTLADAAYSGFAKPSQTAFPSAVGFPMPANAYTFDAAKAKQLLAEAGHPNGVNLTITFSTSRPGAVVRRSAVLIQSMLSDVGIKAKLREVASPTDFYTTYSKGQYQAILYSDPPPLTDPAFYGRVWFATDAPNNTSGFSDPEFDDLLAKLKQTPLDEQDKRHQIIGRMAEITNEANAMLGLVEPANLAVARESVGEFVPTPNGYIRFNDLSKK